MLLTTEIGEYFQATKKASMEKQFNFIEASQIVVYSDLYYDVCTGGAAT
jgi:hypothetical protein